MNSTTKKTLSPEEFYRCSVIVAQIQNACPHKQIDEWPFTIEGKRGYMRQCRDCLMYNPLTVKRKSNRYYGANATGLTAGGGAQHYCAGPAR